MRRGTIQGRFDANYLSGTSKLASRYSQANYTLTPLREVIALAQYGISALATSEPKGVPILRMNNLQNDGWDLTDLKYIEVSKKDLQRYRIEKGDILFNRTNSKELVGKCEVFFEDGDWVFASYLIRVRLDSRKAIPEFVSAFLNTQAGRLQIDRVSRQIIGMSNVNAEELKELEIPLPPLDIQNSLVNNLKNARAARQDKLTQADNLLKGVDGFVLEQLGLELPQEQQRTVYAIAQAKIMQGRLDPLYYAPHYDKLAKALADCAYPKVSLGEISPEIVGGATPRKGDAELYAEGGIKFLRILNVASNEIVLKDVKYIKDTVHTGELKRSQLSKNDVLVTITGRVGTAAVVSEEILPANINQHIVRIRVKRKDCLPEYLAIYLNTSVGNALSNRGVTGGTRIALDYEVIRQIQIPLPPLSIQRTIIAKLFKLRSEVRHLRDEAEEQWQQAKQKFEQALLS